VSTGIGIREWLTTAMPASSGSAAAFDNRGLTGAGIGADYGPHCLLSDGDAVLLRPRDELLPPLLCP